MDRLLMGSALVARARVHKDWSGEIFTVTELKDGVFPAVAAVHTPGEKDDNVLRHVGKYWPVYHPALTAAEPKPENCSSIFSRVPRW